ncbi:hypothetical protein KGO5_02367 [Sinorhizobium sp. KGO-5]|uniref:hypothetical protein n=1 Tax=Sinorhizobium sp. KGO-5 TaxID=1470810 RepID=UPI00294A3343|nr:hypothetical protein KGO5_02367 [Sinorhizobium sp. KGO-5]
MLTRRLGRLIGKPGQSSAPVGKLLNQHANACAALVLALADLKEARHGVPLDNKALVEAFPGVFLGVIIENPQELAARRGDRSDTFFRHLAGNGWLQALIEHLLPGRTLTGDLTAVINHDGRAALVCALSALGVAARTFVAVGDDDGWIILPPRAFIRPMQWAPLEANASGQGAGFAARRDATRHQVKEHYAEQNDRRRGIELKRAEPAVWRMLLKPSFDRFAEDIKDERGDYIVLLSSTFQSLAMSSEVHAAAKPLLKFLNVAMATRDLSPYRVLSNNLISQAEAAEMRAKYLAFNDGKTSSQISNWKNPNRVDVGIVRLRNNICHGNVMDFVNVEPGPDSAFFSPELLSPVTERVLAICADWCEALGPFRKAHGLSHFDRKPASE